jgi:hypothetical protein
MKNVKFIENFHIVLWLVKDTCWLMHFKTGGVIMIIPTLMLAFYLAWKTRRSMPVFLPNLAVCFWISANAFWMLGEFFDFNHVPYALSGFLAGIVAISFYIFRYKTELN